ncbi:409_t:CDS:2 [Funneliformis geosporum]|uniref:4841_t:CDS:1 n=1 Tax=Funneliformis geosporum TaxID=1117311 RepID=A0A9W4SJC6_9GLOM|nr:409_t:CDS:2 [Funneliformis geosporum]CAI2171626.1 4841_t:CDS:2 [Funneliformis geosporum]
MSLSRRPSTRRSTSLYSRSRQETPKSYDQTSDVTDLDSDVSATYEEEDDEETEETIKLEDNTYQSEEEDIEDEQEDMLEEPEEEEEVEEHEEDLEVPIDDDIDIEMEDADDATPEGEISCDTPFLYITYPCITEISSSSHGNRILTKRQRAKLNENYPQDLLQLPMEPMKKKHMTEEEIALKKSEIARRRKHQSIQRAEQDKMDTINRLLKKQSTKRRTRDQDDTDSVQNDSSSTSSLPPSSLHYVNNAEGATLSFPIGSDIQIQCEKGPKYPPPVPNCAFPGCNVPKRYCSVKTFKYACSMDHLHKLESKG